MNTTNTLPLLDRLKAAQERQRQQLAAGGDAVTSAAGLSTMRFKVGDRVIDTATGKAGSIRAAEPRAGKGGQLYAIDLSDGRVVFRGGDELAPDAPAATV